MAFSLPSLHAEPFDSGTSHLLLRLNLEPPQYIEHKRFKYLNGLVHKPIEDKLVHRRHHLDEHFASKRTLENLKYLMWLSEFEKGEEKVEKRSHYCAEVSVLTLVATNKSIYFQVLQLSAPFDALFAFRRVLSAQVAHVYGAPLS